MDASILNLCAGLAFLATTWLIYSSPALVGLVFLAIWAHRHRAPRFGWLMTGAFAGLALAPMPPPGGIIPLLPPALLAIPAGWVSPLDVLWLAISFSASCTAGLLLAWALSTKVPPNNSFKPNPLRRSA